MAVVGTRSAGVAMAQLAAGLQLRRSEILAGTAAAQVILCAVDAGCFFPGPRVPVGHRVVAKRALVATHSADTEIKDAETPNEDTRADADGGANANVDAVHICATREWGALVCA